MRCHRCQGLLVLSESLECHFSGLELLQMSRCINCGERHDATVDANRLHPDRHHPAARKSHNHSNEGIHDVQVIGRSRGVAP